MQIEMVQTEKEKAFQPFLDQLLAGKVEFQYKKKDGSIRDATGTLCADLIPDDKKVSGSEKKEFDHTQNYYDFGANDWRTFIKDNLIGIKQPQ